ncbi:MAG: alpha/beta hydrolase [Labrys sp. (in: a-proteobacteria)]
MTQIFSRPLARLLGVLALTLPLGGCFLADEAMDQARPVPIAHAAELSTPVGLWKGGATVLVATTRARETDGTVFGSRRADGLIAAKAVLYPPERTLLASVNPVASSEWTIAGVQNVASGQSAAAALAKAAEGRDVLLYVHGFNETFQTALTSYARVVAKLEFTGAPVLFTWPSAGSVLDYNYDRESAMWSRDALEETLTALAANPKVGRIHVLAHSMGALALLESLRSISDRTSGMLAGRFGAVILANPDVDIDLFKRQMARLPYLAAKTTVIISNRDRALELSSRLAGGVARVGAADRSALIATGATVVDASEFGSGIINHDLFMSNDEVGGVVRRAIENAGS